LVDSLSAPVENRRAKQPIWRRTVNKYEYTRAYCLRKIRERICLTCGRKIEKGGKKTVCGICRLVRAQNSGRGDPSATSGHGCPCGRGTVIGNGSKCVTCFQELVALRLPLFDLQLSE